MLLKRYWVDTRPDCIAVRDYLKYVSGLRPDSPDVVKYWSGNLVDTVMCSRCGHTEQQQIINEEDRLAANDYCDELNQAYCPNFDEILMMLMVIRDVARKQPKTLYLTQRIADRIMQEQNKLYNFQGKAHLTHLLGVPVEYGHEFCVAAA